MLTVKVLGAGCSNCTQLEQVVRLAADRIGVQADVQKVDDYGEIMAYNVLATPGLVINEHLVSTGRVPTESEVMNWLVNA